VADLGATSERIVEVLDAMVSNGDLLEEREVLVEESPEAHALLYAAPPALVARRSGAIILLGVASGHAALLPQELESRVEHDRYLRKLTPRPGEDLRRDLIQQGLIDLSNVWVKAPNIDTPANHLKHMDDLLDSAGPSGELPGLTLLDYGRPVGYYRGRWIDPQSRSGRFVARRNQAYGADIWCYVEIQDGHPKRLVDLPLSASRWRGCDEAWRLQLAIDAQRGEPQRYSVHRTPLSVSIQFYSPIPAWARRRWEAVGSEVSASGCLFAYQFTADELEEELEFIQRDLWLMER
jgi:hypothetical protein